MTDRRLPPIQLMVVGAAKSGTTSLIRYLGQHPDVCAHQPEEIGYFSVDSDHKRGYEYTLRQYFPCWTKDSILFAKNIGVMYSVEAMQRLQVHNPEVQIVVILRHPVDRAYSDYWYARRRGWENLETFEQAIHASTDRFANDPARQRACAYLDRSNYIKHVRNLGRYFPPEQLQIVLLEDLKQDPIAVCQEIFRLIKGVDPNFIPDVADRHNQVATHRSRFVAQLTSSRTFFPSLKGAVRRVVPHSWVDGFRDLLLQVNERPIQIPEMTPETRATLIDYFRPLNAELSEMLGRDLNHWNT